MFWVFFKTRGAGMVGGMGAVVQIAAWIGRAPKYLVHQDGGSGREM